MAVQPSRQPAPAPSPKRASRRTIFLGFLAVLALLAVWRVATITPRQVKPYLADDRIVVLAHQGASGHAPSDTIEAFKLGLEQGADILELDVHMTWDGVLVVSHDDTIDRMSNGSGRIREMTLAQLKQYDFGYDFTPDGGQTYPYRGKGVTIPTLEEVFTAFPGVRVNIELKQIDPPMEKKTWELIQKHKMADKVLINSFHDQNVARWRDLVGEEVALGATRGEMYKFAAFWIPHLDWLYNPTTDAFQLPTSQKLGPVTIRLDSKRLIERANKLNIKVHYWTINDEETMRHLVEIGAHGIITDYPDRAVKVLKEMNQR